MSSPHPDTAFLLAQALLGHIVQRLTDAGTPPGRAFVSDGATLPAEDCCDGLVWVRVALIEAGDGSGATVRDIRNASIPVAGHAITLEFGTLWCSPMLNENGQSPLPADYTTAALQAAAGRQATRLAVLCDFPVDIVALLCDGQAVSAWTPLDAGGCGGGYMTTVVGTSMII